MERVVVRSIEDGERVAGRIVAALTGKIFDVVSCHSAHNKDITVLESVRINEQKKVVSLINLVKIHLFPRRSICFSLHESPVVCFESDRVITVTRKVSDADTLTRIILIQDRGE